MLCKKDLFEKVLKATFCGWQTKPLNAGQFLRSSVGRV